MPNVFVISLGCPKNLTDTESILSAIGADLRIASEIKDADVVLINTCAFIAPATRESVRTILEVIREIEDLKPRPLLVVTGCLSGRFGSGFAGELPEVDLWLPMKTQENQAEIFARELVARGIIDSAQPGRFQATPRSYAYLKIAEGCSRKCSFCTIPSIRGRYRSKAPDIILAEAEAIVADKVPELILVAQDTTAYGRDAGMKDGLKRLLEMLVPLEGLERLRLLYMYPSGIDKSLLKFMSGLGDKFLPYFDVPFQHCHPDILKNMGRPFAKDPRETIAEIRTHFSGAAIRTSLIAGFPGETPMHFKSLLKFVEETRFHHLGVFPFYPEEGVKAETLPGRVGTKTREKRKNEIMGLQAEISAEIMEGYVGSEQEVSIDKAHPEWPNLFYGRTWFQAPEIDGITYISSNKSTPGQIVRAEITEAKIYDLVALANDED